MGVGTRKASVLRPAGTLHSFDCDGPEVHQDTVQCCHCGRHWPWVPGTGEKRGFCLKCNGITCGNSRCDKCVPAEQQIENMEAGRPVLYRPIVSSVPIDFRKLK
jgi:hypothetical protein